MILLITYDKKNFLKNYDSFYNTIKTANSWWHHLNNTWLIKTDEDPTYWYNLLAPHILANDRLLIIEVKPNYQGWLNEDAWKWINDQFRSENNMFLGGIF